MKHDDNKLTPLFGRNPIINRKYSAEAGLHLFTAGPVAFRPSDIYRFAEHPLLAAALEGTNIYVICQRRRISICPHSIRVTDWGLCGEFIVHGETYFEWERERFQLAASSVETGGQVFRIVEARPADPFGHAIEIADELLRPAKFKPIQAPKSRSNFG